MNLLSVMLAVIASLVIVVGNARVTHEKNVLLNADVEAGNFLAYRKAVIDYHSANSGATGSIADTDLTPYYPLGFINSGKWHNYIDSSNLYVYTNQASESMIVALQAHLYNSMMIGKKNSSGSLTSYSGSQTGITLPAVIPENSTVVVGN